MSFESQDLIEISKFYDKQDNYKFLKSEIEMARKRLAKLPKSSKMLRKLFKKTLDKLLKYKNDQQCM